MRNLIAFQSASKFTSILKTTDDLLLPGNMWYAYAAVQSQKAVSAYLTNEQILPFSFPEQYTFPPQLI